MQKKKEKFPHFRFYKKSNHPALIVGERLSNKVEEWDFRKVSHSERDGRHRNEKVFPNPDKTDKKPMFITKRIRHDSKTNFSSWKYPWIYKKKK